MAAQTNKIELVTQPPKDSEVPARDEALRKLKELVQENLASEKNPSDQKLAESVHSLSKDKSKGLDYSKEVLHTGPKYDEDGFEIPQGKIPLDGHFSTEEVKELIEISKEEGVLKNDVNVNIVESNEAVGDRVEVEEAAEKDTKIKGEDKDSGDE